MSRIKSLIVKLLITQNTTTTVRVFFVWPEGQIHTPSLWAASRRLAGAAGLFGTPVPPGGHVWPPPGWPGPWPAAAHGPGATAGWLFSAAPGRSDAGPRHAGDPPARRHVHCWWDLKIYIYHGDCTRVPNWLFWKRVVDGGSGCVQNLSPQEEMFKRQTVPCCDEECLKLFIIVSTLGGALHHLAAPPEHQAGMVFNYGLIAANWWQDGIGRLTGFIG